MTDELDIDQDWPKPLDREQAMRRLAELLPGGAGDGVWNELIAPLYDARRFAAEWPRGQCYRCHISHPEHRHSVPAAAKRAGQHRMHCPKYVGPLEHRRARSHIMWLGHLRIECTCGRGYDELDDDGNPNTCPDAGIDWRGPRDGVAEGIDR